MCFCCRLYCNNSDYIFRFLHGCRDHTMLRLLIEEILYNHIDTELSVKLKPIFEALRMIKEAERHDEKVRTLEKPISSEVWEYLEEQVEHLVNSKVRTLKTLIIPNEKDPEGSNSLNGASNGLNFKPVSNGLLL